MGSKEENRKGSCSSGCNARRIGNSPYKFYFVEPRENANADRFAERLMGIKNVEEVFVTDGDYGFVVKARVPESRKADNGRDYVSKRLGGSFGKATSHYQYKR